MQLQGWQPLRGLKILILILKIYAPCKRGQPDVVRFSLTASHKPSLLDIVCAPTLPSSPAR